MTYDKNWARSVFISYIKLCTRAQQIDLCICQTSLGTPYPLESPQIKESLIKSIQSKGKGGRLWRSYKRLCKVSPLDTELLRRVMDEIQEDQADAKAERQQILLPIW